MTAMTNAWLQFLHNAGAGALGQSQAADVGSAGFIAPLTHLGLIAASGDDAARFLHAQLTNDIEHLPLDAARLAAYCTAKGRMLASMLVWRTPAAIMLELPLEILAPVQKRLQMFVLRAKVKLSDESQAQVVIGVAGEAAAHTLAATVGATLPAEIYGKSGDDGNVLLRVPDADGMPRYQWIASLANAMQAWPVLAGALPVADAQAWRRTEIQAGIPQIVAATQEHFVPQMINFELVGGVNFRKGCYPGQEIVARSQYLGKLKRRMLPAVVAATEVAPGAEVYASTDATQPCGQIVNAESRDDQTYCLVELKTAVLDDGASIHLGSADGPLLQIGVLPYALTDPT